MPLGVIRGSNKEVPVWVEFCTELVFVRYNPTLKCGGDSDKCCATDTDSFTMRIDNQCLLLIQTRRVIRKGVALSLVSLSLS